MINSLNKLIILSFVIIYIATSIDYRYSFEVMIIIYFLISLYLNYKNKLISYKTIIRISIYLVILYIVLFIDRLFMNIFMCGLDGVGYLQRNGIVDYYYSCSQFTKYEKFTFNVISSLYFPIYVYLFIIPIIRIKVKNNNQSNDNE